MSEWIQIGVPFVFSQAVAGSLEDQGRSCHTAFRSAKQQRIFGEHGEAPHRRSRLNRKAEVVVAALLDSRQEVWKSWTMRFLETFEGLFRGQKLMLDSIFGFQPPKDCFGAY
jgi:hypothetical protein